MNTSFLTHESQIKAGFHYFIYGWRLILQRSLMPFVVLPVLINTVVMVGLIWCFFSNIGDWLEIILPTWLEWLRFILVPLIFLMIIVVFYFTFTTLANFIAAPFNALLAEKVEQQLTGENLTEMTFAEMIRDVPRMLKREWQKMWYSIPRLVVLFLLSFMPVLGQTVVPVLMFIFGAWLLAIQYCDYPFDNHKIGFAQMRNMLAQQRTMNFTFGTLVSLFTMVPFLNLVAMPVAVCGASAMWVKEYRNFVLGLSSGEFSDGDFAEKGTAVSTETRTGKIVPK